MGKVYSDALSQLLFPVLQTHLQKQGFLCVRRVLWAYFPQKHKGMELAVLMGRPGLGGAVCSADTCRPGAWGYREGFWRE